MRKSIRKLAKAVLGTERLGHKYLRRKPKPGGGYHYVYKEVKGRQLLSRSRAKTLLRRLNAVLIDDARRTWARGCAKEWTVSVKETPPAFKGLLEYQQGPIGWVMQDYLRGITLSPSRKKDLRGYTWVSAARIVRRLPKMVASIDALFRKARLPVAVTVYRGFDPLHNEFGLTASDWNRGAAAVAAKINRRKGKMFTDKGYTSTSLSEGQARIFTRGREGHAEGISDDARLMARIAVPAGQSALAMQGLKSWKFDRQKELLLPRSTSFRLTGASVSSTGVVEVYANMEVVKRRKVGRTIGEKK